MKNKSRSLIIVNIVLLILEIVAFIHDCLSFGPDLFVWYTVDSNVLQLLISGLVLYYCFKDRSIPYLVTTLHFISAVGLTITFLIAAFVLAPEGGVAYYFLENVAPINHFLGPLLSVISLLFLEKTEKMSIKIIIWPAVCSLVYGLVCLILNALNVVDGPYFFLQVHKQPVSVIVTWFGIVAVLCMILSVSYYKIKWKSRE